MKKKVLFVMAAITLVLILSACGSSPKKGHYAGKDPEVSFDITSQGIENFTIIILVNGNQPIKMQVITVVDLKPDGTILWQISDDRITGKIDRDEVSGDYSFSSLSSEEIKGKWSASFVN